jgi:hypothetical protein
VLGAFMCYWFYFCFCDCTLCLLFL